MLTEQQKMRWLAMVERGDRQGLVNAHCYHNLVRARFYRIGCERFVLNRKIAAARLVCDSLQYQRAISCN